MDCQRIFKYSNELFMIYDENFCILYIILGLESLPKSTSAMIGLRKSLLTHPLDLISPQAIERERKYNDLKLELRLQLRQRLEKE